jgi:drug/metabolite transporter (DMT)-like permease
MDSITRERLFGPGRRAELALIGITVIWGLTFTFTKKSLAELQPFVFLSWRFILAFLVMFALCARRLSKLNRETLSAGTLLGCLLMMSYAFQTFGLEKTTAGNAGFITGLFIVFTPLLAWAFLGQKQSPRAVLAVVVALTGLGFLSITPQFSISRGDLLVLFCAFTYSVHIIFLDGYTRKYDLMLLTMVQMGVLAIGNTALGLAFETFKAPSSGYVWMSVIVCGLLASALAFYVQGYAQRVLSPARTAMVLIMEPVFSLIFGMMLLGERLAWRGWLGCGLIFLGMLITEVPFSALRRAREPEQAIPAPSPAD